MTPTSPRECPATGRCSRSPAILCGLFAALAAAALVAERACREAGGRIAEAAWTCEAASGAATSLWTLVDAATLAAVALAVDVPVYFGVDALVRRWSAKAL